MRAVFRSARQLACKAATALAFSGFIRLAFY
jgi:hypothetical protein